MSEVLQEMLDKARKAQAIVEHWPQDKVDEMVKAGCLGNDQAGTRQRMRGAGRQRNQNGHLRKQVPKHRVKVLGALRDMEGEKSTGIVEENKEKGIFKVIKPMGVIFAPTPCTNPTATPAVKSVFALKSRNAIIFAPHMLARRCSSKTVEFARAGLKKVGAPEDLIQIMEKPYIEDIQKMMSMCDLVVSTGGTQSVIAAYSSGKPALGVGAGNSVMIVDETADPVEAATKIVASKTFDNATSCSAENNVVIHEAVYDTVPCHT